MTIDFLNIIIIIAHYLNANDTSNTDCTTSTTCALLTSPHKVIISVQISSKTSTSLIRRAVLALHPVSGLKLSGDIVFVCCTCYTCRIYLA